jgi:hypothetical protein
MNYLIKISKLCDFFNKQADLLTDMSQRILFSTLPYNEQQNNIIALQALIPGAKNLLRLGTKAAVAEIMHMENDRGKSYNECLKLFNVEKFSEVLDKMYNLFNNPSKWELFFGGEKWKNITKTLILLNNSLINIEQAKSEKDWEKYEKQLKEMVAYMNAIDGIAHNTGTLLETIIRYEAGESGRDFSELSNYTEQINNVMNAKELKNPNDVKKQVLPILRKDPVKLLPFKDTLSKIENIPNDISVQEQLKLIVVKKRIKYVSDQFIKEITKAKALKNNDLSLLISKCFTDLEVIGNIFATHLYEFKDIKYKIEALSEEIKLYKRLFKTKQISHQNLHEIIDGLMEIYNKFQSLLI